MAKYLVETYYTCSFKVSHYLDDIDGKNLENLDVNLIKISKTLTPGFLFFLQFCEGTVSYQILTVS